jgi:rubrerythrin
MMTRKEFNESLRLMGMSPEVAHEFTNEMENKGLKFAEDDFVKPATCQHCLADARYTGLGSNPEARCPVCGSAYTGPRRSLEYAALVAAGLVAIDGDVEPAETDGD